MKKQTMMERYRKLATASDQGLIAEYPSTGTTPKDLACPEFPEDLTKVSIRKLGRLYSKYSSFLAYVNEMLGQRKFQVQRLKIMKRRRRAEVIFTSRGIKMRQVAEVIRDAGYQSVENDYFKAQAELTAWQSTLWTIQGYIRAIEFEEERRGKGYKANTQD